MRLVNKFNYNCPHNGYKKFPIRQDNNLCVNYLCEDCYKKIDGYLSNFIKHTIKNTDLTKRTLDNILKYDNVTYLIKTA